MSHEPHTEGALPVLTVEQAAGCLATGHREAPYTEACRLAAAAAIRRDDGAHRFWREVAVLLRFVNFEEKK